MDPLYPLLLAAPISSAALCTGESALRAIQWRTSRRDGRVVETGGLENHCTGNRTGGSNPSPSASVNSVRSISWAECFRHVSQARGACTCSPECQTRLRLLRRSDRALRKCRLCGRSRRRSKQESPVLHEHTQV